MSQLTQGRRSMPVIFLLFLLLVAVFSFNAPPHRTVSGNYKQLDTVPTHKVNFTFTITAAAKTSAGVFASDSTLVKTLWSGVNYNAGTFNGTWDGTTDEGQLVSDGTYHIKVLSNNVNAVWEGTIGNNSDSIYGGTVQRGYERIHCMAITGQYAYYGKAYSEGNPSQLKFKLTTPRQRIQIIPASQGMGQASRFVVTDGVNVYWGGHDARSTVPYHFIFATKVSDDSEVLFSAGRQYTCRFGRLYPSVIDTINNANGTMGGLAVQFTGDYLFATHPYINKLNVLNKTTGAVVQSLTFTNPGVVAVDSSNNLWLTHTSGTRRIEKFTVNADGTLTTTGIIISGIQEPVGLTAGADNQTIVMADAGSSQQVKAFDLSTGAAVWTLGQAGGYSTSSQLSNDKFYFSDLRGILGSFIAYQPNGSFWVGDLGNARAQHYTASRVFLDRIQYIPHFYSCFVDPNNPTRVFADYLEYKIDYSLPIGRNNGSWIMVRNWGYNMLRTREDYNNRLRSVTTLSNGRTYALTYDSITAQTKKWHVIELVNNGNIRFTGIQLTYNGVEQTLLYPDGSLRRMTRLVNLGQKTTWSKRTLTGFDANNNPIWSSDTVLAVSPPATPIDPGWFGNNNKIKPGEITSSNIILAFDGTHVHPGFDNYHLGGLQLGTNKWLWRTARATHPAYTGPFPKDGSYDIGNNIEYSGVPAMASGRTIFWGYHGEFWKNSQTNMYNIVYDNGLFVNQFGVLGPDVAGQEAVYGMAGNAYCSNLVRMGDTAFIYHNDEGHHGGIHRWRVTGLNGISVQTVPVSFSNTDKGLTVSYYNKDDINNMNHVASFIDSVVRIDKSNVSLADTNNFSVSYTGFIQPLYTENYRIYTATNKGVRLWVGDSLLVDQRNTTTAGEYSDTLRMTAGLRYPLRLEVYHTGGASDVSLSWSSTSVPKGEIPAARFSPAELPDYLAGYNLLEKLHYNKPVENNLYGFTRDSAYEIDSVKYQYIRWWSARMGMKGYNRLKPDLYIKHGNKTPVTRTLSRDLGFAANGVTGWQISGTVNYDGNIPNEDTADLAPTGRGGHYLEVLDDQGKVMVRFFWAMFYGTNRCRLYANDQIIATGSGTAMKAIYSISQPLQISMTNDSVKIQYGPFASATVPKFDAAAHWNKPKTFRFYAWTNTWSSARIIDIEQLQFSILTPTAGARVSTSSEEPGVDLTTKTPSLKMYPNPVYGSGFYLQYKGAASAGMTVVVTDLKGRVVLSRKMSQSENGVYPVRFNAKPKAGVYLVIINGRFAERLIVK